MLAQKILAIYPSLTKADFGRYGTIKLRDDGNGAYIAEWNHPTLVRPTQAQLDAAIPATFVPLSIKSHQFRREVRARGKKTQFLNWLSTASEDAQEYFQFTDIIRRSDPEFQAFVAAIGFTQAQVNDFFIAASQR